jgi:hypothetical protein
MPGIRVIDYLSIHITIGVSFRRQFEDLAIGVLTVYDRNTRENVNDVLVIRYLKDLEMDSLELAVHCKCKRFVSNSTVQCILDNIWLGKRNDSLKMVSQVFNKNIFYIINFLSKD